MEKPDSLNIPAFQRKKMLEKKIKDSQKPLRATRKTRPKTKTDTMLTLSVNNTIPTIERITASASTITPEVTLRNFKPAGTLERYFQALKVAIISTETTIRVGDKILFEHEDGFFEQTIDSIQINRQPVEKADKGCKIGIQTLIQPLSGRKIYKEL
ncbi:hypothetical protein CVV38_04385 [Candidatus Peregrinibacteria bacterium HGW-Peregrinibacteria-1]|jgi:hypothetical protein|nr:MAG: hypothetical protein CVV38_04385 [Candidatus Peregrinibacteria bacterium HGW-Peregrinibacteria-1]